MKLLKDIYGSAIYIARPVDQSRAFGTSAAVRHSPRMHEHVAHINITAQTPQCLLYEFIASYNNYRKRFSPALNLHSGLKLKLG